MRLYEGDGPTWLFVPALGVEARYYDKLGEALAAFGIRFAALDAPGHGAHSLRAKRGVDFGYAELVADVRAAADVLAQRTGDRVVLGGHSLGGQASFMAGTSEAVAAVCVVACCIPYIDHWEGRVRTQTRLASRVFPVLANAFGYFPGHLVQFADREGRRLMLEWSQVVRTGRYPEALHAELDRLDKPVTAIDVRGDIWSPARAVDALSDYLKGTSVARSTLEGPWEAGQAAHFKWARLPQASAEFLAGQVKQTLKSR